MLRRQLSTLAMIAASFWLVSDIAGLWSRLPTRIATHFDLAGNPNGWSTPTELVCILGFLLALFWGLFAGAGRIERLPDAQINVPQKDYWLAPERRAATFAAIISWLRWQLVITLTFLTFIVTRAVQANLAQPPKLSLNVVPVLAGFLVTTLAMIVQLWRRFRVPRSQ